MFDGLQAWLEPFKTFDGETCIVAYCQNPCMKNKKGSVQAHRCSAHDRMFHRRGTIFTKGQQKEINYYANREWQHAS